MIQTLARPSFEWAGILLLVGFLSGCAAPIRGYPGTERTFSEVATVQGFRTVIPFTSAVFEVTIEAVNGASEVEAWTAPSRTIQLMPGSYTFDVTADWVATVPAALLMKSSDEDSSRSFTLFVEGGRTYEIHFERERKFFYVVEIESETKSRGDDLELPEDVCRLAPTPKDRERCEAAESP
ncbi:MAG: hypothetical protein NXI30_03685 [bacterium]|nr:hypothetical protein [bacterium]